MKYIVANKALAVNVGFSIRGHRSNETGIILNEKEVMFNRLLEKYPTLEEKAEALEGTVCSLSDIKKILNDYE